MKPIQVNESNEKYIKKYIYTYNKTIKNPKFKINDLVRISQKEDLFLINHLVILNGQKNYLKFIQLINQT